MRIRVRVRVRVRVAIAHSTYLDIIDKIFCRKDVEIRSQNVSTKCVQNPKVLAVARS